MSWHPPPPYGGPPMPVRTPDQKLPVVLVVTLVVCTLVTALALWTAVNPRAQVPVISEIVCSVKGRSWYEGDAFGNPPGCYDFEGSR